MKRKHFCTSVILLSLLVAALLPVLATALPGQPSGSVLIQIDIKPGSDDNVISLGSQGVIPVALLTDGDFIATTVIPENVYLEGYGVAVRGKGSKYMAHQEDIDGDGDVDLVVQIEAENLDPSLFQDGYATLWIAGITGTPAYWGWNEVTVVPPQ